MAIHLFNISDLKISRIGNLKKLANKILKAEKQKGNFNIVFCNNAYMKALNLEFRNLNKTTDVLSFTYDEKDVRGEIYISTEKAQNQAPKWNNSYYKELKRLVIHGILHTLGYDHMVKKDKIIMFAKEALYLQG